MSTSFDAMTQPRQLYHWASAQCEAAARVSEAIAILDQVALGIVLVVEPDDTHHRLLGVVTDGDIRRAILKGINLDQAVRHIMNPTPVVVQQGTSIVAIKQRMQQHRLEHIPVVDEHHRVTDLVTLSDLSHVSAQDAIVVLMAGGFGTRLRPLTETVPKPMLNVGSKPILQTILENFVEAGFHRFYISVHYKAEQIKRHFGDGSQWGVTIDYLEENEPLGTAGCLSLLPQPVQQPVILMNGDLLTKVDFAELWKCHQAQNATATLCVRDYHYQVPYGVVEVDGQFMTAIVEKPQQHCFVSAGIYVLSPQAIARIQPHQVQDVPTLLQDLKQDQKTVNIFPIHEYWLDIGRMDDFHQAQLDFAQQFSG